MTDRRLIVATGVAGALLMAVTACSSSGDTDVDPASPSPSPTTTPTSASPTPTGASTVAFDKKIQSELAEVGCYSGAVDGVIGPETDQAIVAFQEAVGLAVDGELGPDTDAALKAAAAEGTAICTQTSSPTSTPSPTSTVACTAQSIAGALESDATLVSFRCADVDAERWAAGQEKAGSKVTSVFLRAQGGTWVVVPGDEVCGTASAGLPPAILDYCDTA